MSENSKIEWTDATWNPIVGCTRVSEGCRNCYAEKFTHRFAGPGQRWEGLTEERFGGIVWTGKIKLQEEQLNKPLSWKKPRRIFVNSMSDLFHENISTPQIMAIFEVMLQCPQHTFMILTKRPKRMQAFLEEANHPELWWKPEKYKNIWLGVSVENQQAADERIPLLLQTPAAVRFLSCEPLLGPVDLTWIAEPDDDRDGVIDSLRGQNWIDGWGRGVEMPRYRPGYEGTPCHRNYVDPRPDLGKIDWVIAGGESGVGARPMHPDWVRSLRDQCQAAGVPFFFKQWGEWKPISQIQDSDSLYYPAPEGHPEATRKCKVQTEVLQLDGSIKWAWPKGAMQIFKIGKKAAGRQLDGRTWDEFPEVRL